MTHLVRFNRFRRSYLALTIGLSVLPAAHAMQELSDHSLSDTTGEGVALTLENFKMVFQGPNDLSSASSYNLKVPVTNPERYDTGFIRIIPTGENYNYQFNKYIAPTYATYKATSEKSNYTAVYNEILASEIQSINTRERAALIAYEKTEAPDSFWMERYLSYYNGINIGLIGDTRDKLSRNYADNDMRESDSQYKNLLAKVDGIVKAKAALIAEEKALVLAPQRLQQNFDRDILPGLKANKVGFENFLKAQNNKADIFVYGVALSSSNSNLNERFSNTGFNWGTAENPWLIRAGTEKDLKQFTGVKKDLGYLALEAPLTVQAYTKTADVSGDIYSRQKDPTTSTEILNLQSTFKLGLWTDIFARSLYSNGEVNPVTGAPVKNETDLTANQRLRLQMVANGISINGSQAKMFQTMDIPKVEPVDPKSPLYPKYLEYLKYEKYAKTFGMALLLRINTDLTPDTVSYTNLNDGKAIRISTAAKTDTQDGSASTPALDGSFAPIFSEKDGMILYSPNINLVLGNMHQPFIVGSDGKNIILEVTEIPNIPDIYNKIYTDYSNAESKAATLCNFASCGSNTTKINGINYQGNNATHSSITIGTVNYDPKTNMIKANTGDNANGVVFRDVSGAGKNLGSVAIDGVLIQHLKFKTTGL